MYFAPISQATKYNYLDDKFQAAYKWLAETDLDNTPAGSYPICEGVTANVQEYTTFPASEGSFETHDKRACSVSCCGRASWSVVWRAAMISSSRSASSML